MRFLKQAIHRAGRAYVARLARRDESRPFLRHNERPVEYAFALRTVQRLAPRAVLDVGTGTTAWPALLADCGCRVTAVDNVRDYWPAGMVNRHWHVRDCDITAQGAPGGPYDLVTCISVLEHVRAHREAVGRMRGALVPGGHLVLCGPYTDGEYVEDCYRVPGADPASAAQPYICRSYSRRELDGWLGLGFELAAAEYSVAWTGRHWALGERVAPPTPGSPEGPHNHACFLLRRVDAGPGRA